MARNQVRNLETFRVGSGAVNEFEYQKNQGQLTEQLEHHSEQDSNAKPVSQAERVKQIMAAAHEKVEKRKKKASVKTAKKPSAKGSTKAASTKKPAKKSASKKSASKKATSKKATSKKAASKKAPKK